MANTVSAQPSIGITYSITDSRSDATLSESTAVTRSIVLADGTGTGLVNMGMSTSGYLPSGGFITKDFKSLTKTVFGSDITLDFTNIKPKCVAGNIYVWRLTSKKDDAYTTETDKGKLRYHLLSRFRFPDFSENRISSYRCANPPKF